MIRTSSGNLAEHFQHRNEKPPGDGTKLRVVVEVDDMAGDEQERRGDPGHHLGCEFHVHISGQVSRGLLPAKLNCDEPLHGGQRAAVVADHGGHEHIRLAAIPREPIWGPLVRAGIPAWVALRENLTPLPLVPKIAWTIDEAVRKYILFYLSGGKQIHIEIPDTNRPA